MTEKTILIAGLPSDPCVTTVREALTRHRVPYYLWNQRNLLNDCRLRMDQNFSDGILTLDESSFALSDIGSVFNRLSEIVLTPEYRRLDPADEIARHAVAANWLLGDWFELAPICVINRNRANEGNSAKAYQLQTIRHYLPIPETVVTNDLDTLCEFWQQHGRIIYKSCSGERSIVTELDETTLANRASSLAACPVLFQAYIEGTDVRVHVVGNEVYATAVRSQSTDYRYDSDTTWTAIELSETLSATCVRLTTALGLTLSGIDLRITPTGEVYCFEVNPSPAFSIYEEATGQPIADAITRMLIDPCLPNPSRNTSIV